MTAARAIRVSILVLLLFQVAALFGREFARRQLLDRGVDGDLAKDLSYLVLPVVLGVLMWPILREHRDHLRWIFRRSALSWRIVFSGLLAGLLLRAAWWLKTLLRIDPIPATAPVFRFDCPPPLTLVVATAVTVVVTPLIEEAVHRGLLTSGMLDRGKWFAVVVSSLLFAAFHPLSGFVFVFFAGVVFALQYLRTGAAWLSLVTHATYNGLLILDWRCLSTQWGAT